MKLYVVQQGDSAAGIAEKHSMTLEELKKLNPDLEERPLYRGMKIKVSGEKQAIKVSSAVRTEKPEVLPAEDMPNTSVPQSASQQTETNPGALAGLNQPSANPEKEKEEFKDIFYPKEGDYSAAGNALSYSAHDMNQVPVFPFLQTDPSATNPVSPYQMGNHWSDVSPSTQANPWPAASPAYQPNPTATSPASQANPWPAASPAYQPNPTATSPSTQANPWPAASPAYQPNPTATSPASQANPWPAVSPAYQPNPTATSPASQANPWPMASPAYQPNPTATSPSTQANPWPAASPAYQPNPTATSPASQANPWPAVSPAYQPNPTATSPASQANPWPMASPAYQPNPTATSPSTQANPWPAASPAYQPNPTATSPASQANPWPAVSPATQMYPTSPSAQMKKKPAESQPASGKKPVNKSGLPANPSENIYKPAQKPKNNYPFLAQGAVSPEKPIGGMKATNVSPASFPYPTAGKSSGKMNPVGAQGTIGGYPYPYMMPNQSKKPCNCGGTGSYPVQHAPYTPFGNMPVAGYYGGNQPPQSPYTQSPVSHKPAYKSVKDNDANKKK
ncbi:LysM peptidoglycan-binding domain-containing protein [Sporolactobacillus sp. THM19-2]|uniref:LysM peptidoglycan-binding domain-containing protein n=1 Tax=Sporolactobacillus sp. THM19-2 TaxID=2511171 RepID=UPI0013EDB8B9|nr:LysM domain-containing protein [Sporolactobacillus sp. THM19-2]